MFPEALALAFVASIYPPGLLATILYLLTPRPRATSLAYYGGALTCTLIGGVVVTVVLRSAGLSNSSAQAARYGLRLAIGVALLVAALIVRRRPQAGPASPSRAEARPSLPGAFAVGIALYTPSPTYLTSLQHVATAEASTAATTAAVILVAFIVLFLPIELPLLTYFVAPNWAQPRLNRLDTWVRVHTKGLIVGLLVFLGVYEVVNGLRGLL
jgi:hypothetical protein